MKRALATVLVLLAFGAGAAGAQGLTGQEKQILPLIKANWLAFRNYSGRQFIYFTILLAYRCGLSEIRYSVNSDALDRTFPLPPCEAVTVHEPPPLMCTVVPESEQFPFAANDTASPDDDVAATEKSGSRYVLPASGPNAIVWFDFAIENERVTSAAGL